MKKRIAPFVLPLVFLSLMMTQAGALVVVPCEVERVKDVYFIRLRGDYQTLTFLMHYVNLSPAQQEVAIARFLWTAPGTFPVLIFPLTFYTLAPGESIDLTTPAYGLNYLNIRIWIDYAQPAPPPLMDEWVKFPASP